MAVGELTIPRSVLITIADKAIEAGRGQLAVYLKFNKSIETYKIDAIRDVVRSAPGVDFAHFDVKYGCPVTQAGLRRAYGFWFSLPYDRLMHAHLEVPHQLEQGWGVRIIDDLS